MHLGYVHVEVDVFVFKVEIAWKLDGEEHATKNKNNKTLWGSVPCHRDDVLFCARDGKSGSIC